MTTPLPRLALPSGSLKPHYDVVVVGSGYGGGVSALRLARAGKSVAVLERGREVVTGEFPSRFPDLRKEVRVSGKRMTSGAETALYDVRIGDDMHVLVGNGLGGTSLVNAGVALRPDGRVFGDLVWPGQVMQDGLLDEGFRRAARWLSPCADPAAATLTKFKALAEAGKTIGAMPRATTLVVGFEDRVNAAGIAQPACTRCGDCCAGCNVGAKNTVALTYLPAAKAAGAELYTHVAVRHVTPEPHGRWRISFRRVDGDKADGAVTADAVILAAGTLGSTELLLKSREQGLALSDRLGQGFSANGDIIAFGYGAKHSVNGIGVGHPPRAEIDPVGAAVSGHLALTDASDLARELNIQEGVPPSALAPMLPALFIPNGRLLGAVQSLISGVYKGPFASLQTFFAVSHDSANGRLVLEDGALRLTWPGASSEPVYQRLDQEIGRLVTALGGSYVKNPLAGTVMGHQPATAHPLGGCGMGIDGAAGVVDHKSRVLTGRGNDVHRGLYVIDGSIIPRSLGVNPLLTITALAERAMLHMASDHGLACAD